MIKLLFVQLLIMVASTTSLQKEHKEINFRGVVMGFKGLVLGFQKGIYDDDFYRLADECLSSDLSNQ
jgi:hypothetical protein